MFKRAKSVKTSTHGGYNGRVILTAWGELTEADIIRFTDWASQIGVSSFEEIKEIIDPEKLEAFMRDEIQKAFKEGQAKAKRTIDNQNFEQLGKIMSDYKKMQHPKMYIDSTLWGNLGQQQFAQEFKSLKAAGADAANTQQDEYLKLNPILIGETDAS